MLHLHELAVGQVVRFKPVRARAACTALPNVDCRRQQNTTPPPFPLTSILPYMYRVAGAGAPAAGTFYA